MGCVSSQLVNEGDPTGPAVPKQVQQPAHGEPDGQALTEQGKASATPSPLFAPPPSSQPSPASDSVTDPPSAHSVHPDPPRAQGSDQVSTDAAADAVAAVSEGQDEAQRLHAKVSATADKALTPGTEQEAVGESGGGGGDDESNWDACSTGYNVQQPEPDTGAADAPAEEPEESPSQPPGTALPSDLVAPPETLPPLPKSQDDQPPEQALEPEPRPDATTLTQAQDMTRTSIEDEGPPLAMPADDSEVSFKETTTMRVEKLRGCMFVNQYLVVKFLGRGACGKVFLCLNTQDLRLYAMKAVRKVDVEATQPAAAPGGKPRRNPMEDLKREILIMRRMKHPHIVMLSEVIDDPAGSKLLLVMEYMAGGPVLTREALEHRERLPEMLALQYFRDMVKSLDYLHCHKVVHGDLKPENVLMTASSEVKLSDFGCSKIFATGNEYLERCNGTPAFLAPEMMKPHTRFRGRPTDVYALGTCLYTLVFGRIPFSAPNLYKLFQVVQTEPVRFPPDVMVTEALKHLLHAMLSKNPKDRIALPDIMRHPWVTMGGQFPLKSTRDLEAGETQERHSGLVNGLTFAESHPCPDYLSGLALQSHHERHFKEGDYVMRQGDQGTFLLYIISGAVDVLVRAPKLGRQGSSMASGSTSNLSSRGTAGGGGGGGGGQDEFGGGDDDGMATPKDPEAYAHRLSLARAASKARDFVESLQQASGAPNELLVAQRGPGELVGEMALFSKQQLRAASVRCASPVIARVITHEQLVAYVSAQPMARHQIRECIWKKESEVTIVDALVKLGHAYEASVASLAASAPPGTDLPLPLVHPTSAASPTSPVAGL